MGLKALEILEKQLKIFWELYAIGHKNKSDIDDIEEAIAELKAININKTCNNCNNFKQIHKDYPKKQCSILNIGDIGGCNVYWESKC